jgi:hypothetical protein
MYKHKVLITAVFVCLAVSASNAANIIYVDANSPSDPGAGTFGNPFRKIQDGINSALPGDTALIRPGVYSGPGNYDLNPNGKAITISSTNPGDAVVVANTVIAPNSAGRGFDLQNGEDANCVLSGLTIRNARAVVGLNGAGIFCYSSSPTIRNCVIENGYAEGSGGGLYFYYSNATVINCTITGNAADYYGGGISCSFSAPLITGCTISGNTAGFAGGGLDGGQSDPNIFNCVIIGNDAPLGGGIDCYYPGVAHVVNCTLAANSADNFGGAVYCWYEGSAIVKNSIFWANSASYDGAQLGLAADGTASVTYCDVQGGQADVYDPCEQLVWGGGNIGSDPCFALFAPAGDPNLWDFHLRSAYGRWESNEQNWVTDSNTSLCIDAGNPNSDWTGEPWPNGKRINMGAYGGTGQASKNGNIADLNIDGKVNFVDFAQLGNLWGSTQKTIEDLDGDGIVNLGDLDIMATNWLWEKP